MKEYGVDLEQQLKAVEQKKISIENKITKRAMFLINKLKEIGTDEEKAHALEHEESVFVLDRIDVQLNFIKEVEVHYVGKSKQTELFK